MFKPIVYKLFVSLTILISVTALIVLATKTTSIKANNPALGLLPNPGRQLSIFLYQQEVSNNGEGKLQKIPSFSNQLQIIFLRFEYISPEAVTQEMGNECAVNKITFFEIEGDKIMVNYSGPNAIVRGFYIRQMDTRGVAIGDQIMPINLFSDYIVCNILK